MSYQDEKMKILIRFKRYPYGNDEMPHLSGDEASHALDELVKKYVVGKDNDPWIAGNDGHASMAMDFNYLRASQRKVIDTQSKREGES